MERARRDRDHAALGLRVHPARERVLVPGDAAPRDDAAVLLQREAVVQPAAIAFTPLRAAGGTRHERGFV